MASLIPRSSVAKKLVNGLTGLALFLFVVVHLSENLLLLSPNPDLYNAWAHFLFSFGPLLYAIEVVLGLFFLVHIVSAISVWFDKRRARRSRYAVVRSAGGPSRKTLASRSMILTGIVLLAFLIWHLISFRFGPNVAEGYVTTLGNGEVVRDLYRLVVEFFSDIVNVALYVAVMVLLGFHLRHGFWSAFQSLGAYHPRWTPLLYGLGWVLALVLAVGFIFIPIWVYVTNV